MQDVEIDLEDRPGSLADMGEALGRAGVSVEGGGVFVVNGKASHIFCSKMAKRPGAPSKRRECASLQCAMSLRCDYVRKNRDNSERSAAGWPKRA